MNINASEYLQYIVPVDIRNFSELFKQNKALRLAGIGNYLVYAYNIIFLDIIDDVSQMNLDVWQREKINLLLAAGENLIKTKLADASPLLQIYTRTINKSKITYIDKLDLIIQAAENNYINDLINKTKRTDLLSITQQKSTDKSSRLRRIENNFGTKTYKIKAAVVFYLMRPLSEALAKKDINNYGQIIHDIHRICFEIEKEMPRRLGGQANHSTEKVLRKLYAHFFKEYHQYGDECLDGFDWGNYANSECIKTEFAKHAKSNQILLPDNTIELYEIECLKKNFNK